MPAGKGHDSLDRSQAQISSVKTELELVSVNVGQPRPLGERRGQVVLSAIAKRPVTGDSLYLDTLNLEGDRQADLRVHGGRHKAVYAYPSEHWPRWSAELGREFGPASFGENLSTRGWLEHEVRLGDRWAWGAAILEVSQPRQPCFKLQMHTARDQVLRRMIATGRTGWYLRVLQPGRVPVGGPLRLIESQSDNLTILETHLLTFADKLPAAELEALLASAPLPADWRQRIQRQRSA